MCKQNKSTWRADRQLVGSGSGGGRGGCDWERSRDCLVQVRSAARVSFDRYELGVGADGSCWRIGLGDRPVDAALILPRGGVCRGGRMLK